MPIQLHTAPAPDTAPAPSTAETRAFYEALFGLDCAMDTGWLVTLEPGCAPLAQCGDDGDGATGGGGDVGGGSSCDYGSSSSSKLLPSADPASAPGALLRFEEDEEVVDLWATAAGQLGGVK